MKEILLSIALSVGLSGAAKKISFDQAVQDAQNTLQQAHQRYGVELPACVVRDLELSLWDFSSGLKINNKKAEQLIEQARLNLIFRANNTVELAPLSMILDGLEDIFYIKSSKQTDGWSCGHWSTCHAKAVDQLLENRRDINSVSLRREAGNFRQQHINFFRHKLEPQQVNQLAIDARLNRHTVQEIFERAALSQNLIDLVNANKLHVLVTENGRLDGKICMSALSGNGTNLDGLEDVDMDVLAIDLATSHNLVFNHMRDRFYEQFVDGEGGRSGAIHFACYVPGHWILISIVKLPHLNKPIVLVQDSAEWGSFVHSYYIRFLHEVFIQREVLG